MTEIIYEEFDMQKHRLKETNVAEIKIKARGNLINFRLFLKDGRKIDLAIMPR